MPVRPPGEAQVDDRNVSQLELRDATSKTEEARGAVDVPVDLCYGSTSQFIEEVRTLLSRRPERIALDMGAVRTMDSSGLKALLEARKLCEAAGVELALGPVSECAARVLKMSRFDQLFGLDEVVVRTEPERKRSYTRGVFADWRTLEHVADSDPSLIGTLRESVSQVALDAGATDEMLCDIRMAVGEALTNAYKHGSPKKGNSKISVTCMSCPEALVVEVCDEGKPFDPDTVCRPDPKEMQDHGMGIFLMRQAMDVVEFRSNCPGNRVRMIKWLSTHAQAEDSATPFPGW